MSEADVLLGLSVVQPWASAVALYRADLINRPRPLPAKHLGCRVAIVAASYRDTFRETVERRRFRAHAGVTLPEDLPRGCIVAVARLVGCVEVSASPWFDGPFGWLVEDVHAVSPLPYSGFGKPHTLPHDVANTLRARLLAE